MHQSWDKQNSSRYVISPSDTVELCYLVFFLVELEICFRPWYPAAGGSKLSPLLRSTSLPPLQRLTSE